MEEIKYIGSFPEILGASEPNDPRYTVTAIVRLPNTQYLEPRYAMVFAGAAAEQLVKLHAGLAEQIAQKAKAPSTE